MLNSAVLVMPPYFEWQRILQSSYGVNCFFFYALDGHENRIRGVLPTYVTKRCKGRQTLYSLRYGLVADDDATARFLLESTKKFAEKRGICAGQVSSGQSHYDTGSTTRERTTVSMDLTATQQETWNSLRDKTRNSIRKGTKYELGVECGNHLYHEFYELYSTRMVEKSLLLHKKVFFKALIDAYPGDVLIYVAKYGSLPVSAMLVLFNLDSAIYLHGGARAGYERQCPTHYLLWEVVKDCYERKVSTLDLGESTPGGGVYKFKTWFGGVPRPLYYYDLFKSGTQQQANEEDSPVPVVRSGGKIRGKIADLAIQLSPPSVRRSILIYLKKRARII